MSFISFWQYIVKSVANKYFQPYIVKSVANKYLQPYIPKSVANKYFKGSALPADPQNILTKQG